MRRAALTAAAVVIAPLATPLTIWLAFTVFYLVGLGWFADKPYWLVFYNGVLVWSYFAAPLAYVVTVVAGVPASLVLRKRRWVGLQHFVALGIVLGVLPFVVVDIVAAIAELLRRANPIDIPFPWMFIGMGALCGIGSATVFWLVGVVGLEGRATPSNQRMEPTRAWP